MTYEVVNVPVGLSAPLIVAETDCFFFKRESGARKGQCLFLRKTKKREREREESDSLCSFLSRANILFWKNREEEESISLSRSFSLSWQKTKNKTERKEKETHPAGDWLRVQGEFVFVRQGAGE